MSTRFAVGDLLLDRFHIIDVKRGGMGEVAICQDKATNAAPLVAFKSVAADLISDSGSKARFQREAEAWMLVGRGGLGFVLPLDQVIVTDGMLLLKMPYCSRGGLDLRLLRGPLSREEGVEYATQLLIGLHSVNVDMGVVHRDLKPSNILFDEEGRLQIADFGLAKFIDDDVRHYTGRAANNVGTQFGQFVGTVPYAAPEQLLGTHPIDWRADMWAFGIVVYEMFMGRRPFPDEDADAHLRTILAAQPCALAELAQCATSHLANIVKKCLEPDPNKRFQTFGHLIGAWDSAIRTPDSPVAGFLSRDRRVALPSHSFAEAPWTGLFFPERTPKGHKRVSWDFSAVAGTAKARDYYRLDKFEDSISAAEKTLGQVEDSDSNIVKLLNGTSSEKSSFTHLDPKGVYGTRVEPSRDMTLEAMHWLLRSLVALVEAKRDEVRWPDYLRRITLRLAASELRDTESQLLAAQGFVLTGEPLKGLGIARALLNAEPLNVRIGWVAFQALRTANNIDEARVLAKMLTCEYVNQGAAEYYRWAVRLSYAAEDWKTVTELSAEAARLAPNDFENISCIASAFLIVNRREDARPYYEMMRALAPDAPHTRYIAKILDVSPVG